MSRPLDAFELARWEELTCYYCQAPYALRSEAVARLRQSHTLFYCPLCNRSQLFKGQSDEEKLRAENAKLQQRLDWKEGMLTRANERAETAERRRRSTRAVVTKLKKRAAGGLCPCCSEKFPDLQRHIETAHPTYGDGE